MAAAQGGTRLRRVGVIVGTRVGAIMASRVGAIIAARVGAIIASLVGAIIAARVGAIGLTLVGAIGNARVGAIVASLVGAMGLTLVGASGAMAGHHSVLPFDGAQPVTIAGTVVRVLWQDPHALIAVDVPARVAPIAAGVHASGVERWTIESEGATALRRLGWTGDAIRAGDHITVLGAPARDGRRLMRCAAITLKGGRRFPCFESR